ncbi:MAG: CTP synthase, partial [Gaiellales bacterium]
AALADGTSVLSNALFADVDVKAVVANKDVDDVYLVPLALHDERLDALVCEKLALDCAAADLEPWHELARSITRRSEQVEIALVGKYIAVQDAYLSVAEALKHAGIHHGAGVELTWVAAAALELADGVLVPGGFGGRAIEGKIFGAQIARERELPYLGICLGMQVAVIEFARNVCGLAGANSSEFDPETPYPVIDLLPEQKGVDDLGGTMRLGADAVDLEPGTKAYGAYGEPVVHERHRHRYEVNNHFRRQTAEAGLQVSGTFQEGRLVEIVELPEHPWFVASQFHPEFKSRPWRPAPLFQGFVGAALDRARSVSRSKRELAARS